MLTLDYYIIFFINNIMRNSIKNFNYHNMEVKLSGSNKVVRKVYIKNGKGYKSVCKFRKDKKHSTIKKPIHSNHIELIQKGKFIPGLFLDCKKTRKSK
jgi:hypothetical protein